MALKSEAKRICARKIRRAEVEYNEAEMILRRKRDSDIDSARKKYEAVLAD